MSINFESETNLETRPMFEHLNTTSSTCKSWNLVEFNNLVYNVEMALLTYIITYTYIVHTKFNHVIV